MSLERASATLLVCDDEPAARRGMTRALGREGFRMLECGSGHEALAVLEEHSVDLVLLDLRMAGLDGRATLERIVAQPEAPPVVMVTADSQLRTALDCLRAGAADFLAKPYDIAELRWVVRRTLESRRLSRQNRRLRSELVRLVGDGELLGDSPAMAELRDILHRAAPTDASLLIRGETGTGKELVARTVHRASAVADGPFVALNCAAVPESLLESELFGHRKGAFTGADRDRAGRLQEAHGGTFFLDEVGDMPLAAQAKLLRVLQERRVEPLGGGKPRTIDVRVLAATHRDLESMVEDGSFRQDLYFRLRVVEVEVPALRLRGDDVLLLARAFLQRFAGRVLELSADAARTLLDHRWPGNVRELENAMQRAAIFCRGSLVEAADLPSDLRAGSGSPAPRTDAEAPPELPFVEAKARVVEAFERRYFDDLLRRHEGNISRAAREAGLHRQNLQKKLRQLDLDAAAYR